MSSPSTRVLAVVVGVAALLVAPVRGQQPPPSQKPAQPTFRVQVELVEVDAVARDKTGRFINDLKKDDFQVLEDGKPQATAEFELVDVPVEPRAAVTIATGRTIEPDVFTNGTSLGRVYLIVVDDLHVNPSRTIAARKLARQFIEQTLAPNDVAAVVSTSGSRKVSQEFTSNRRLLLDAVDRIVGRKILSPGMADLDAYSPPGGAKADEQQRLYNARSTFDTLAYLAQYMGTIHSRRKSIVMIGEGVDYDLGGNEVDIHVTTSPTDGATVTDAGTGFDNVTSRHDLRDRLRDFINVANRANVTLYAFDPTVYTQGGDDLVDIAAQAPGDMDQYGREINRMSKLQDDVMAAQDNLRTMTTETGGFAVTGSLKAAATAVDRIRSDNSHYYILGYYPTNDKRDGKYRNIDVRVKRAGIEVLARKGYISPKTAKAPIGPSVEATKGTSAALVAALSSTLPTPGLPVAVTAVPFRGTAQMASVLVMLETPPGAVEFARKDARVEGNVEVAFVAIDDSGRTRGGEHLEVAMPLKPETYAVVQQTGLIFQSRVDLPPGRYVMRIGARDASNERVGSVHCDLEVPDYAQLPLSMSGLLVASAAVQAANPRPDAELTKLLAVSPTVRRDFPQGDQLVVLAEVYDAKAATPHQVDIVTTVTTEDGRVAFKYEDTRSSAEIQAPRGSFGYLAKVPLTGLPPGPYLLRVEAHSRLDSNNPVSRETTFRIVGHLPWPES